MNSTEMPMNDTVTIAPPETLRALAVQDPDSMQTVIQQLQHMKEQARDFLVPARRVRLAHRQQLIPDVPDRTYVQSPRLLVPGPQSLSGIRYTVAYEINRIAHEQLADKLGIHMGYYRKLQSSGDHRHLFEDNVNYWLAKMGDQQLLIRTLDDHVRAVLSDHYLRLDSFDLMLHTARVANSVPGAFLQRFDVTEEKFFARIVHADYAIRLEQQADGVRALSSGFGFAGINDSQGHVAHSVDDAATVFDEDMIPGHKNTALFEKFEGIATHPDWIVPVVLVRNSEVGRGGLSIDVGIFQTYCTNTAFFNRAMGRIHRGSKLDDLLSDDTRRKQDELFWAEVEDVIHNTFNAEVFGEFVNQFLGLQDVELKDPAKSIEQLAAQKDVTLSQDEQQSILNGLISQGMGSTAWGLVNAVTAFAHTPNVAADRRVELEELGGRLIQKFPRELVAVRR